MRTGVQEADASMLLRSHRTGVQDYRLTHCTPPPRRDVSINLVGRDSEVEQFGTRGDSVELRQLY